MKKKSLHKWGTTILKPLSASFAIITWLLFSCVCLGDDFKPNINDIIRDTQKVSNAGHEMNLVWWVPEQYWRTSFEASQKLTPQAISDFLKTIKPYTVFAVVKGKIGSFGAMTYEDEATIRGELVFVDSDGNQYTPLADSEINSDMKNFIDMMKPIFANMLGSMGQNIDFYLFPAMGKNGKSLADPEKEGRFSVRLARQEFKWRLPLGSVLSPKICPKCGEKLSGAYKFCPYDGTALDK